jgi:hypothetical protein
MKEKSTTESLQAVEKRTKKKKEEEEEELINPRKTDKSQWKWYCIMVGERAGDACTIKKIMNRDPFNNKCFRQALS